MPKKYPTVAEAVANGLMHPGCRHRLGAYFPGISGEQEKQGKPEQYEAEQRQRSIERQIRAWKRRAAVGDPAAPAYVRKWQAEARKNVDASPGVRRRYDREGGRVKPASRPVVLGMDAGLRHSSQAEAKAWADSKLPVPTGPAKDSLYWYTGSDHRSWNQELRAGHDPNGTWGKATRDADSGFSPVPESIIVNRAANLEEFKVLTDNPTGWYDPLDLVGTVQTQRGYMSTSIGVDPPFSREVEVRILVPKGQDVAWLEPISRHPEEMELLLPRDTPLFIHEVYRESSWKRRWIVEAEVIPAGSRPTLADVKPHSTGWK